jgi:hypothetical protein
MEIRGFLNYGETLLNDVVGVEKTVTETIITTFETTATATTTTTSATTDTTTTTVSTTAEASTELVTSVVTSQTTVTASTEQEVRMITAKTDEEDEETSTQEEDEENEETSTQEKSTKTSKTHHPKSSHSSEATHTRGSDSGDQTADEQATSTSDAGSEKAKARRGLRNRRGHFNQPQLVTSTLAAFGTVTSFSTLNNPEVRAIGVPTSTALQEVPVPSSTVEKREDPSAAPSDILVVSEAVVGYNRPSESSKAHTVRDCGIACFDEGQTITTSVSVASTPLVARENTDAHGNPITALDKRTPTPSPYGTLNVPNTISHGVPVRRHAGDNPPFLTPNLGNSSNTTLSTIFVGSTGSAPWGASGAGASSSLTTSSNSSAAIKHRDSFRRRWPGYRRRVPRHEVELDLQEAAATTTAAANGRDEAPLRRGVGASFVPTSTLKEGPFLAKRKGSGNRQHPQANDKTTGKSTKTTSSSRTTSSSSGVTTTNTATTDHSTSGASTSESKSRDVLGNLAQAKHIPGVVNHASALLKKLNDTLLPDPNDQKLWAEDTNGDLPKDGKAPQHPLGQQSASRGPANPSATPTNSHDSADGQVGSVTTSHLTSPTHAQATEHTPSSARLPRRSAPIEEPAVEGTPTPSTRPSTPNGQGVQGAEQTIGSATGHAASLSAGGHGDKGGPEPSTSTSSIADLAAPTPEGRQGGADRSRPNGKTCPVPAYKIRVLD